jgi:tetratricopeptide (TPR) repeat protein
MNLGAAFQNQGRPNKAIQYYVKAAQYNPRNDSAYYHMGLVLARNGKFNDANRYFQKAIQIKPDHWEAHYNLGVSLLFLGNKAATAHFSKAIQINPDCSQARIYLEKIQNNTNLKVFF